MGVGRDVVGSPEGEKGVRLRTQFKCMLSAGHVCQDWQIACCLLHWLLSQIGQDDIPLG